jgi:hypothetical protein
MPKPKKLPCSVELTRRAQEIAARHYEIPHSERTSVSVDTLLEWALRYRNGGFDALAPQARQDRGQSRTITPQLADLIERLKRENPHRTGTTLLRELALSSGKNEPAVNGIIRTAPSSSGVPSLSEKRRRERASRCSMLSVAKLSMRRVSSALRCARI